VLPYGIDVLRRRLAHIAVTEALLHQGDAQQGGMTLVHVVYQPNVVTQRAQDGDPAHAQHDLLPQSIIRVAPVQVVREGPVPRVVVGNVRVQQVDRNRMSVQAGHHVTPRAHPHESALDLDRDGLGQRLQLLLRPPLVRRFRLVAPLVQALPEEPFPVKERHPDQR
jgi:hypothetical protein